MPPEIMLRDPLDQEFVLNRKMAKKYYETQLQQRMTENRMKNQEKLEKKKKDVLDYNAKEEKHLARIAPKGGSGLSAPGGHGDQSTATINDLVYGDDNNQIGTLPDAPLRQ